MNATEEDIILSRRSWFWRRITLQVVLGWLGVILSVMVGITAMRTGDWPTAAVQIALIAGMAWLVTMYFAQVNNADRIKGLVESATEGLARAKDAAE